LPLERNQVKGGGERSEGRGRTGVPFEDGEVGEQLLEGVFGLGTEATQALEGGRGVLKAGGARGGR